MLKQWLVRSQCGELSSQFPYRQLVHYAVSSRCHAGLCNREIVFRQSLARTTDDHICSSSNVPFHGIPACSGFSREFAGIFGHHLHPKTLIRIFVLNWLSPTTLHWLEFNNKNVIYFVWQDVRWAVPTSFDLDMRSLLNISSCWPVEMWWKKLMIFANFINPWGQAVQLVKSTGSPFKIKMSETDFTYFFGYDILVRFPLEKFLNSFRTLHYLFSWLHEKDPFNFPP